MRVLPSLVIAALVLFGAGGGCSSTPVVTPKGRVEVPVSTAPAPVVVKVALHHELVLHLPPLTTPGTEWTLVFNDTRFIQPWRGIEPAADGGFTVAFLAIREGRRQVRFLALPPGQREATATQSYEARIEIQ